MAPAAGVLLSLPQARRELAAGLERHTNPAFSGMAAFMLANGTSDFRRPGTLAFSSK